MKKYIEFFINQLGMRQLLISFVQVVLLTLSVYAQDNPMQRDLKVMEEVLTEIFKREIEKGSAPSWRENKASATYIDNYGILIRMPVVKSSLHSSSSAISISSGNNNVMFDSNRTTVIADNFESDEGMVAESKDDIDKTIEKIMRIFLMNYGDLARDLSEDERIVLYYAYNNENDFVFWNEKKNIGLSRSLSSENKNIAYQISAEVLKKDLIRFKQGKLTEDAFWETVKIKKITEESEEQDMLEFGILARIFERLLSLAKEESFQPGNEHIAILAFDDKNTVKYQVLNGLGVIYHINLNYPLVLSIDNGKNHFHESEEEDWREERDQNMEEIYPEFIEELKENVIEYGRTLRKLSEGELLIVEAALPFCFECDLPATVKLSVEKSILESYDSRKIDLYEAINRINVKEEGRARNQSRKEGFIFDWRE